MVEKEDALRRLWAAHDAVKAHPYRYGFSSEFEEDYLNRLLDLSDAWCDLIYRTELPCDKEKLLKKFGDWIHNYNASLLVGFIRRELMPFYDGVLSVTHRYLISGEITGYWALEYRYEDGNKRDRKEIPMWFYLVTKELCGINSPELPAFFPKDEKLSEDKERFRNYLDRYFHGKSKEFRDNYVDEWEKNFLPVIRWHNQRLKDNANVAPIYRSL